MKSHGTIVITGSLGLLGSACVRLFSPHAERIIGIDNSGRGDFFGEEGEPIPYSPESGSNYLLHNGSIVDGDTIGELFKAWQKRIGITAVIHCAAQPAHDYSAKHPLEDFQVNALGTLHVLEAARKHCPEAPFVFASSSKVYGDSVNLLPMVVDGKRFKPHDREYQSGIKENYFVDQSMHSPYGCGKLAADLYVQEYGRYYGMRTACFRPGTITGPDHAAVELHGFIAYLVKCCATGRPYTVNGYGGYQVRDVIHADDLARAFAAVVDGPPKPGEPFVTNFGGGLHSNCSMLEAIDMAEAATGKKLNWTYNPEPRRGDHMWYVGSCELFMGRYGRWTKANSSFDPTTGSLEFTCAKNKSIWFEYKYTLPQIVAEIAERYKLEGKVTG